MMVLATVTLKRTECEFWTMTPRKLASLAQAYIELNETSEERAERKKMGRTRTIDTPAGPQKVHYIDAIM